MSDLISRQDVIDAICMDYCGVHHEDCTHPYKDDYYYCEGCGDVDTIKALPSADPERKTGKWMVDKYGAEYCSECGKHPYNDGEYYVSGWWTEFCPNCGARMEE